MSLRSFKFFEKKERVFTQWMDEMDDYHLGGIRHYQPIDETYPEYYNTDEYVFFDVTEVMFDPIWSEPYKFMLFRHIEEGNTVQGRRITPIHPMWNFSGLDRV
jgi:hypothetical protein